MNNKFNLKRNFRISPPAVVQKEREKFTAFQETAEKLKTQINTL
ncbi:MAG: hypothetical protein ACYC59_03675 [Anaerolineaceae bacterium]